LTVETTIVAPSDTPTNANDSLRTALAAFASPGLRHRIDDSGDVPDAGGERADLRLSRGALALVDGGRRLTPVQ
jgi:hypothetical protein